MKRHQIFTAPDSPPLDFPAIEAACGLHLKPAAREALQEAVDKYRTWTCPAASKVPATQIRRSLEKINKAASTLAALIEAHAQDEGSSPDAVAMGLSYPTAGCVGWIEPGLLAEHLKEMASNAAVQNAQPVRRGRREAQAQDLLILALHRVYAAAGGEGLGCYGTDSGHAGRFYAMVVELVRQAEGTPTCVNPAGIGDAILALKLEIQKQNI